MSLFEKIELYLSRPASAALVLQAACHSSITTAAKLLMINISPWPRYTIAGRKQLSNRGGGGGGGGESLTTDVGLIHTDRRSGRGRASFDIAYSALREIAINKYIPSRGAPATTNRKLQARQGLVIRTAQSAATPLAHKQIFILIRQQECRKCGHCCVRACV